MKKESFLTSMSKLIMTVTLIVGIGAVLGILVYSETIPKSEVVINDVVEKGDIKDEMADWKTYRNEEYGFELKYPGEWESIKPSSNFGNFIIYFESSDTEELIEQKEIHPGYRYNLSIKKQPDVIKDESGEIMIKSADHPNYRKFFDNGMEQKEIFDTNIMQIKTGEMFIGNTIAYEYIVGGFGSCYAILLEDASGQYYSLIFDRTQSKEKLLEIEKTVLSTFKFIEKDETADWQSRENEIYGFEVEIDNKIYREEKRIAEDLDGNGQLEIIITLSSEDYSTGYVYVMTSSKDNKNYTEVGRIESGKYLNIKNLNEEGSIEDVDNNGIKEVYLYSTEEGGTSGREFYKILDVDIKNEKLSWMKIDEKESFVKYSNFSRLESNKIYRDEEYGFELKYPENWEYLINDGSRGQKYPSFRDKKYAGGWEWPGLDIEFEVEPKTFKLENAKNDLIIIYFTNNGEQPIKATCKLYGDNGDKSVIDVCNQILFTFKFIEK